MFKFIYIILIHIFNMGQVRASCKVLKNPEVTPGYTPAGSAA